MIFSLKDAIIRGETSRLYRRFFERVFSIKSMSLNVYLWGIRLFLLLSLGAWVGIIVSVDPYRAGMVGTLLFFSSLFGVLLGLLTLFVTWVYRKGLGEASAAHHLGSAFRQAFLLALFVLVVTFLQMERLLTWWDSLLVLAAVLLCEFTLRRLINHDNEIN